jgi:hypothetical protein
MDLLRYSLFSLEIDSVGPHLGGARWLLYSPQGALASRSGKPALDVRENNLLVS